MFGLTKLNIVDGTFDPARREQLEDGIPDGLEDDPAPPGSQAGDGSALVLKKGGEATGETLATGGEKGDTGATEEPVAKEAGRD